MNKDDEERLPGHHLRRRPLRLREIFNLAATPWFLAVVLLLILSFVLGYLYRDNSYPLISQSVATAGDANAKATNTAVDANANVNSKANSTAGDADADADAHNRFSTKCRAAVSPSDVRRTIINNVYNGTSPWDGFPPAHSKKILMREFSMGWGSHGAVFEKLMRQVRPRTIVEVGTYLGASAIHMAGLARKLGLPDTQILCIDDFRGWPGHADNGRGMPMVNGDTMLLYQFMQNVVHANATDSVLFLPFSTTTALNGLCHWGVYGDLVEIDADHDFHSAWVDINNGYKVVKKPGGVLFGHDYVWEGVRRAVHMFARQHGLRVRRDGEHWVLY